VARLTPLTLSFHGWHVIESCDRLGDAGAGGPGGCRASASSEHPAVGVGAGDGGGVDVIRRPPVCIANPWPCPAGSAPGKRRRTSWHSWARLAAAGSGLSPALGHQRRTAHRRCRAAAPSPAPRPYGAHLDRTSVADWPTSPSPSSQIRRTDPSWSPSATRWARRTSARSSRPSPGWKALAAALEHGARLAPLPWTAPRPAATSRPSSCVVSRTSAPARRPLDRQRRRRPLHGARPHHGGPRSTASSRPSSRPRTAGDGGPSRPHTGGVEVRAASRTASMMPW
jgi:hypothetical protein